MTVLEMIIMKIRNIMKVSVLAVLLALGLNMIAPVNAATILLDFGSDNSYRGVSTPSPDKNGNYWNSVDSFAYFPDLVDIDGNATTVGFGFGPLAGGTDSYNGPAGDTSGMTSQQIVDATAAAIDPNALGNLGIAAAACDYYDHTQFTIQGLDPAKTYNLTFFGSHKYDVPGITTYTVYTDGTYSVGVASTTLNNNQESTTGMEWEHNQDEVATLNNVSVQSDDSIWIGAFGYINCMQIEEGLGTNAWNPEPSNGATGIEPTIANLKWNHPVDITPDKYILSFNANDPNWINATVVDPVVDLNLDGDPDTTEAAIPITLDYDTTYYWKVTVVDDPNEYEGPTWLFTTEAELQVDAGPNIITWLDGGIANVDLNGVITYPYTVSDVLWSVIEKPVTSTVIIDDDSSAVTSASFDEEGDYVLELWAEDSSVSLEDEDTMTVRVFADACEAAKANPSGYIPLTHDSTDDCTVDLSDFAELAIEWLADLSLTENLEY